MPKGEDLVHVVTRRLADLRRERGVTQERLAELLDLPVQHVSRIEGGQNVTLATLERVATALGVTVVVSFEPRDGGPKKPSPSRRQRTRAKRLS